MSICWSPSSKYIATGSSDKKVKIWMRDPSSDNYIVIRTLTGHSDTVSSLMFISDHEILSGSYDKTLRVWSTTSEEL